MLLAPRDIIRIDSSVLSLETRIRPEGTITLPHVGVVDVGSTLSELEERLRGVVGRTVGGVVTDLEVTVVACNHYRFAVHGEVVRQGVFTSMHRIRLSKAIAMAGGLTRFARRDEVSFSSTPTC